MRRKTTPVDAESIYTLVDTAGQPKSPCFHHKDLADACQRTLSKQQFGLSVRRVSNPESEGGVNEAIAVLPREQRWLEMSRSNKGEFPALCEGCLTAPKQSPVPNREVANA